MARLIAVSFLVLFTAIAAYSLGLLVFRLPFQVIAALTGWQWPIGATVFLFPAALALAWMRGWLALDRPYYCRGEVWIDAGLDEVWSMLRPRGGTQAHHAGFVRYDACPGEPDRFDLIVDPRLVEDGQPDRLQLRLAEEDKGAYLRLEPLNAAEFPLFAKDHVSTEYYLENDNGGTRLTMVETIGRITPGLIVALLYLNPARDGLKRLKSLLEGKEDDSRLGAWVADMDGEAVPTLEVQRSLNVAAATVIVATTLLAAGVLVLVFRSFPPQ